MRDLEKRLTALEAVAHPSPTDAQHFQAWVDQQLRDPWEPFWESFSAADIDLLCAAWDEDALIWTPAMRAVVARYARVFADELTAAIAAVERGVIDVCDTALIFDHVDRGSWSDHYRALRLREWVAHYCTARAEAMPRTAGELLAVLRTWRDEESSLLEA